MAQVIGLLLFPTLTQAMMVKDPAQIYDYIAYVAGHEGVSVGMALAIAKAESGFNPNAHNPKSSASGIFQFLDSSFRKYCIEQYHLANDLSQKDVPVIQVNCAIYVLKEEGGWRNWLASFSGWKRYFDV